MKKLVSLLMLILGLSAAAQDYSHLNGKTINVIGDSYVRNHKRPYSEAWHSLVAERNGMTYRNYGKNGNCIVFDRTDEGWGKPMLERYKEMNDTADYVLVIAGHNDAVRIGDSADSLKVFRDGLALFCQLLINKYPNSIIAFVTPWDVPKPGFKPTIAAMREICALYDIPCLDASTVGGIMVGDEGFRRKYFQRYDDTAHLNADGHELFYPTGLAFIASLKQKEPDYTFHDTTLSDDERISRFIDQLSAAEKIDLLGFGSVRRLGVRPHGSLESIHGLVIGGPGNPNVKPQPTTAFPQGYGLGETWDKELMSLIGEQISTEARALFNNPDAGVRAGLVLWTPNADLGRDPRWGRTEECYGEDPMLVGQLAAALIKGMQGDDARYWRSASLMKHFLANSNENERTRTSSDLSDKLWREYYSYGFRKGFEAGGSSYMAAYNKLNGVPCTVHPMLKDIVAGEWGVDGIVSTDGGAFGQLLTEHHYFDTRSQAAAACVKNGVNQFLDRYREDVIDALSEGLIEESEIDACLAGRIRIMLKLGLLDAPDNKDNPYLTISGEPWNTPEAHNLARRATDESIVLLKNDNKALPLDLKQLKRIAVIGNKADTVYADWYGGEPPYRVTPLQGIRRVAEPLGIEVRYVKDDRSGAVAEAARWADVVIACVGNHPCTATEYETVPPWAASATMGEGREAIDRQSLQLDAEDMIRVAHKHNPNVIVTLISSFPYAINWTAENIDGIIHCTQSSQELGNAIADVIFGAYNPGGRLTQTWPRAIDDLPDIMDYDITNGRTYMYAKASPLFAFGHGLSYTTFKYSGLDVRADGDKLMVTFDITNTGAYDGDEVPQIYVTIPGDDAKQRLKAFERLNLKSGEKTTVTAEIPFDDLKLWDEGISAWTLPKGKYQIHVSTAADSPQLTKSLKL